VADPAAAPVWDYYVQVWDDKHIWAQPLCEGTEFVFDQVAFVAAPDGSDIVVLCGYTERLGGSSFAVASVGFAFCDEKWSPIVWEDVYEQENNLVNIDHSSDGFRMIYYDEYMAQTFMLPQHEGPLYRLELSQDGTIIADLSQYPSYPGNVGFPSKAVLYRLCS